VISLDRHTTTESRRGEGRNAGALETTRGKPAQIVAIAVARELATFAWEIATLG